MPRIALDCPECGEKCTVVASTAAPVQCCPFCSNTLLLAPDDDADDDVVTDDDLHEFDPDDE